MVGHHFHPARRSCRKQGHCGPAACGPCRDGRLRHHHRRLHRRREHPVQRGKPPCAGRLCRQRPRLGASFALWPDCRLCRDRRYRHRRPCDHRPRCLLRSRPSAHAPPAVARPKRGEARLPRAPCVALRGRFLRGRAARRLYAHRAVQPRRPLPSAVRHECGTHEPCTLCHHGHTVRPRGRGPARLCNASRFGSQPRKGRRRRFDDAP